MVSECRQTVGIKGPVWPNLIFFLFCYVYMGLCVQPRLIYDGFGTVIQDVPEFATGWEFLRDSLRVPGGLTVYAYGFLSQGYYYSWLGALIVVLAALCLGELARRHCTYVGRSVPAFLRCVPAMMVVWMYNGYDHPLAACLTVSLGLSFSCVFEKMPSCRGPVREVVFCLTVGVVYWLGGAGAAVVFSLMTAVHGLLRRRDRLGAILALPAAAAVIWVLADYVFYLSPRQAFVVLTPLSHEWTAGLKTFSKVLLVLLYILVPAAPAVVCLWRGANVRSGDVDAARPAKTERSKARAARRSPGAFWALVKRFVPPVAPITVLALGLYLSYDKVHRQIVVMNALSRYGRWSEVLELGKRLPKNVYNIYCNYDIDRALFHAGRLGYDMLCFPQNPHALLLTHEQEEASMTQVKMCDAFIELGNVDLAQKLASEFVVAEGNLGIMLEKLAWIHIIKGQEDSARIYLNALRRDLICRGSAAQLLDGLENGFGPDIDASIRRVRSCIRQPEDGRLNQESIVEMLTGLLRHNPRNRMAFEYLMACYLLAGQVDEIAANIGRLKDLGYPETPTLYEEAMLIYYGSRRLPLDPDTVTIKRETIERYERFLGLNRLLEAQGPQAVLPRLLQEFGASYFFYYRFTVSRRSVGSASH